MIVRVHQNLRFSVNICFFVIISKGRQIFNFGLILGPLGSLSVWDHCNLAILLFMETFIGFQQFTADLPVRFDSSGLLFKHPDQFSFNGIKHFESDSSTYF